MKINLNSRQLQNIQHIFGGLNSLILLLSGVSIGQSKWIQSGIMIVSYFILNRISSEIFYRILKEVERESHNDIKIIENEI